MGTKPARVETRTRKVEDGAGGLVDHQVRFPICKIKDQKADLDNQLAQQLCSYLFCSSLFLQYSETSQLIISG